MTARPLDFDFLPMSEISRRAPFAVPIAEQVQELTDELGRRRDLYPMRVTKGQMTQDDADRHIAILDEILADMRPAPDTHSEWIEERWAERLATKIIWEDKVRELRREIAMRRNFYPKMIATGRILEADACQRLEALDAVHWRYWIEGFTWDDRLQGRTGTDLYDRHHAFTAPRLVWELAAIDGDAAWAPPVYDGFYPAGVTYGFMRACLPRYREIARRFQERVATEAQRLDNVA